MFIDVDWCQVRLLRVREKLSRSRFRTDPAVMLERQALEKELLGLEKAQRVDRNFSVLARCLMLALTTYATLLVGYEGLIFEPEGIISLAVCWSLVLFFVLDLSRRDRYYSKPKVRSSISLALAMASARISFKSLKCEIL